MTVKDALRAAMREHLGPSARAAGFGGSAPTWRRSNQAGDWAIANVQMSPWGDREHGECYINLAVAPAPWLAFESRAKPLPKTLSETYGLFRDRLGTSWDIPSADAAEAVVLDMVAALERDGWPLLTRLLDRTAFLDHLRTVGLGEIKQSYGFDTYFAKAEAILLSDDGPSTALDELLNRMTADLDPRIREAWLADVAWIRARAQSHAKATSYTLGCPCPAPGQRRASGHAADRAMSDLPTTEVSTTAHPATP